MLLVIQASYEPLAPLGETNVEEYLNYHHQVIINAAIDDAKVRATITCYITLRACVATVIVLVIMKLHTTVRAVSVPACRQ
jgi:hypothetical protein